MHFELPGLPETTNAARGKFKNWRQRHKHDKSWKYEVWAAVNQQKKPRKPLEKAQLRLIRHSSTRPDYEGLVSTFKPIIDGLIESGVIINDNHDVIGVSKYEWIKAAPGAGKIEVFVEEVIEQPLLSAEPSHQGVTRTPD